MSTGQSLLPFAALQLIPPSSGAAAYDVRNNQSVWGYTNGVQQDMLFSSVLPRNYSGGGITLTLVWAAAVVTSGNVVWQAQWERHQDGVTDMSSDHFATAVVATAAAVPGTAGIEKYTTIAFTNGAQINSLLAGERFRLKISRLGTSGSDTAAGIIQLLGGELKES